MKTSLLATTLLNLLAVASASAADGKFAFEADGQIGLCPGVAPRVLSVGTVGATRSGGCCGSEENWTQDMMGQPWMPNHNIRADIENGIRGMDYRGRKYNVVKLHDLVPWAASFVESNNIENGKISVCVSKLDLVRVNQNRGAGANGTEVQFDVAFKYYLALDTAVGPKKLLVEEVGGQATVNSAFYNLYYDETARPAGFINDSWDGLQTKLGSVLSPVSNAEAQQGLADVANYLGDYIGNNGR
jgi:hypothetical protein